MSQIHSGDQPPERPDLSQYRLHPHRSLYVPKAEVEKFERRDQDEKADRETRWRRWFTVAEIALGVLTLVVLARQARIMSTQTDIQRAQAVGGTSMPYIAIDFLNVKDIPHGIDIDAQVKNFGNGPAYDVIIESDATRDGESLRASAPPRQTPTIYPPGSTKQRGIWEVTGDDFDELVIGNWALRVTLDARYTGADGKSYRYHAHQQFDRATGGFSYLEEWCVDTHGHRCGPEGGD